MDSERRQTIIDAASELFAHFGFKKTSMDDVAKKADVAKGTLYLAAPSKADLFYEVLLSEIRRWNAEAVKEIDPSMPADQLLITEALQSVSRMNEFPLVRDLLLGGYDDQLPKLRPRFRTLREICVQTTLEILRIGVRQGRFRADLDLEAVAHILLDLHTSTFMFHFQGPDSGERMAARAQTSFELLLRGLIPRGEPA